MVRPWDYRWVGFTCPNLWLWAEWFSVHAKGELETYITQDFSLQVLDPNGAISEEDFLEMSSNEKRSVMSNNSYWVDLDSVTGNTDVEVTRNIPQENLIQAQVYRLYVGKSTAAAMTTTSGSTSWNCTLTPAL
ncbi:MAG: hypothetical protein ACLU9S_02165 [Oscillospiraceae bacterium]